MVKAKLAGQGNTEVVLDPTPFHAALLKWINGVTEWLRGSYMVHTNRGWPYTNDQRKQWETSKATVGTEMADEPIAAKVGYDIMNWLVTINYDNS
jgi:hypothetical protein